MEARGYASNAQLCAKWLASPALRGIINEHVPWCEVRYSDPNVAFSIGLHSRLSIDRHAI